MRCLLLYYSLTGQAGTAVDIAARTAREEGWEAVTCRIDIADPVARPKRPFRIADTKHWVNAANSGATMPLVYEPASALDGDYDLVLLFSNTWDKHPSVPVNSFLNSEAAKVLDGRQFGVIAVCRKLFENNIAICRKLGEAAGGRFIGSDHVDHWGGQIGSMIQTITYIHRSDDGLKSILGIPLPRYGLSDTSIAKVPVITRTLLERATPV